MRTENQGLFGFLFLKYFCVQIIANAYARSSLFVCVLFDWCKPSMQSLDTGFCRNLTQDTIHGVYLHSSVDLISGASVVTLVPRPCSPFCHFSEWKAGRGLGTRQQYSRVRLPQQLHEQHTLLCILSWACVLFVMLFRQHGTLCHVRSYVSLLLAGSFVGHFNNMTIPF